MPLLNYAQRLQWSVFDAIEYAMGHETVFDANLAAW